MSDQLDRLTVALADRYTVERELGRGGMATVYLAEDVKHRRKVAIKVLDPELARALGADRFLREVEVTANLTHPHILPLYDSGQAAVPPLRYAERGTGGEDFLYYVMPYIEGETLRDRMKREGQLPLDDALQITRDIAAALSYAHSRDVIHRDIKPENVLLSAGEAVVADFGIARAITEAGGDQITETGLSIGTPAYMSPEQASGERRLDGRSDVYSLGCVLYEMLAGEPPYTGPTAQSIVAKKLSEAVPRVSVVRERVPASVEAAIDQALAKAPADRFPTAAAFAAAIDRGDADDRTDRVRANQRSPAVWVAAIAAVVIVAVALVWRPWSAPSTGITSVAVLPLANMTGGSEQAVFVDGIHDALIAELQQLSAFERVISRTSVLQYRDTDEPVPEIATALDVDAIIEGTVQRVGNTVRVRVTLIGAFPERDLWTQDYQSDLADVLTLQRSITGDIAREIALTLTLTEEVRLAQARPVSPEAFNLVLLGREAWNMRDGPGMRRAVALYNQALAIDSTYAEAYVGLSDAYNMLAQYGFLPVEEGVPLARESAEHALAFDSMKGNAYTSLAEVHFLGREWDKAEQAYRRAIELTPGSAIGHHFFGWFLSHMGRDDEAIAMLQRARELDPLSAPINADLAAAYLHARRYDEAWTETERTLAIARGFHRALWLQVVLDVLSGEELDRAIAAASELEEAGFLHHRSSLALPLAAAGREAEARALLEEGIAASGGIERLSRGRATIAATVYLELGDTVATWEMLERMVEVGIGAGLTSFVVWPFFDPLRGDPRFVDLVARMGYPQ